MEGERAGRERIVLATFQFFVPETPLRLGSRAVWRHKMMESLADRESMWRHRRAGCEPKRK